MCCVSVRQLLHIAPSNVSSIKTREPLDNPDSQSLANATLDGHVNKALNSFHNFKKRKFTSDEVVLTRKEMAEALSQLGVPQKDLPSGEAYLWEVLNPQLGGHHVVKQDFDDWIEFARQEKEVLKEQEVLKEVPRVVARAATPARHIRRHQ